MKHALMSAVLAVSVLAGCGGAPPVDTSAASLAATPIGTFQAGASAGEMKRMVLMADGTAHLDMAAGDAIDCYYQLKDVDGGGHMDFMDRAGAVVHACDYTYDGRTVQVIHPGDADWQALDPAPVAWCEAASQCEQQWLTHRTCLGQWSCVDNGCQYSCRGKGF